MIILVIFYYKSKVILQHSKEEKYIKDCGSFLWLKITSNIFIHDHPVGMHLQQISQAIFEADFVVEVEDPIKFQFDR